MSSPTLRTRVEETSRPLLLRLHALPRLVVPLVTVLLVGVAALAPLPYAWIGAGLALVLVAWIGYLSWPVATVGGKVMRITMILLLLALAASRLLQQG
ncbi:MAG: DUF6703 family protein [Propionibacteriaceae bacterium]